MSSCCLELMKNLMALVASASPSTLSTGLGPAGGGRVGERAGGVEAVEGRLGAV